MCRKFRVCPAGCVLRPLEDQLVLSDPTGLDPHLRRSLPTRSCCLPTLLEFRAWPWGASLRRGGGQHRGAELCVGPALVSHRELLSVSTEGEEGPQGGLWVQGFPQAGLVWGFSPVPPPDHLAQPRLPRHRHLVDEGQMLRCMVPRSAPSAAAAAGPAPSPSL